MFGPMRSILPVSMAVAEVTVGQVCDAPLHPGEAVFVRHARETRQRDFAAGRACARRALVQLGLDEVPVLVGPAREPLWPPGVTGSITHCQGYCAAAVGWTAEVGSVGIDAELHVPLEPAVAALVCTPDELAWISQSSPQSWETVTFSAKESVYKAWFPVTRQPLDFQDVAVCIDPAAGRFTVSPTRSVPAHLEPLFRSLHGRFAFSGPYVMTSAQLAHPAGVAADVSS